MRVTLLAVCIGLHGAALTAQDRTADVGLDFDQSVAPILVRRCLECHNDSIAAGSLRLTTHSGLLAGGDSGPVVQPGQSARSELFRRISEGEMPPERKGIPQKLPAAEIAALKRWIDSGAKWPASRKLDLYEATNELRAGRDWWSLQPVQHPAPPLWHSPYPITEIDRFVLARLGQHHMTLNRLADRRTLLRRLYYDLTGLPPTFEQIEQFVSDESPDAWESQVDRLLESPHFGERWARHWLDLVRFAETSGYERDQEKPFAWKYRDWVVQAINSDLPYDEFVIQQLAGDELADRTTDNVIATGFLRLGTWNDEPNDPHDYKYDRLEDLVHTTSTAFLGMTFKCARCHDHKFDPIPQQDYYRIAATFWPGPIEPRDRGLLGGPSSEELGVPEVLGWTDVRLDPPPFHLLKNGSRHQPLEAVSAASPTLVPHTHRKFEDAKKESRTTGRRLQLARWIASRENPLTARVIVNRLWLHHFGQGLVRSPNNFGFRGDPASHPELLDWLASELMDGGWRLKRIHKLILMSHTWRQSTIHTKASQYEQIDAGNRLLWRANRRRLEAEALRDSMLAVTGELDSRFGGKGFRPTITPEALEGLSRKQSAWSASPPEQQLRRSLYIYTKRGLLPPLMTTFDFCDTTAPCGQRDVTTVAPQALALLNSRFTHARSTALAHRVQRSTRQKTAGQPTDPVQLAWQFAFGRLPSPTETRLARRHLEVQAARFAAAVAEHNSVEAEATDQAEQADPTPQFLALASLCHVLLNSNEFIYVD